ncbi:MAG: hypothetical protein D6793_02530 [Thermoflexia bacterium]|nr:MAG: hypothetical protein D6793_02530 [Thermoflexia bacterium]
MTADLVGLIVGTLLTLMVLSYLLGDNPFYRLALHILVGATVGYGTAVALRVLLQRVLPALSDPAARLSLVVPVVLGILLLFKGFPRWASWGNLSAALLVGVGAAVALSGALLGTILPQARAVGSLGDWLQGGWAGLVNGLLGAMGTACALLAFAFAIPRNPSLRRFWNGVVRLPGRLGRVFLLVAFGAAFATALTASLSVLVGRVYAVVEGVQRILSAFGF